MQVPWKSGPEGACTERDQKRNSKSLFESNLSKDIRFQLLILDRLKKQQKCILRGRRLDKLFAVASQGGG